MISPILRLLPLLVLCGASAALADPMELSVPSAAQRLAASCANCHGVDGRSQHRKIPSLAGKSAAELMRKLLEFRQGDVKSTVMGQIAIAYSEDELRTLAEYFSLQSKR